MQPIRRRKKRPNYGVRTVEISRGKNGFGFTISGQQPCILSCIVAGSPAEKAGLRPGDYLVAVNGQSVSKVPHDDVVRLIGCSSGVLKLQIAENYYSDSSDEDVIAPRPRPKYLHKPRSGGQHHRTGPTSHQGRAAKLVRDLRVFEDHAVEARSGLQPAQPLLQRWKPPVLLPPPPPRFYAHTPGVAEECRGGGDECVGYRALVGYLGTIEMPEELQPGTRLQVVRGSIRRLRNEKRAHTPVLMSVRAQDLVLTDYHGATLARYPAERVAFCGPGSDSERRYFGLVTTTTAGAEEDGGGLSSSCHVFCCWADSHHMAHAARAEAFQLRCATDPATGTCREFPTSSDALVAAVRVLYQRPEPLVANSPQPSNASSTATTTSSNSDSGIGFRDECGNQSDRILMVDVQNQRLHIQQVGPSGQPSHHAGSQSSSKSCVFELTAPPPGPSTHSRSPLMSSSSSSSEAGCNKGKTGPRHMDRAVDVPSDDLVSIGSSDRQLHRSPPVSHSLEDLKGLSRGPQHWGSLQELRSFVAGCFEQSPPSVERLGHHPGAAKKWAATPFLGRAFGSKRIPGQFLQHRNSAGDAVGKHSDPEQSSEPEEGERGVTAGWATAFEKLLDDPAGLHTFAEFLKKEFSHENIYFWVACERYRASPEASERAEAARDIFQRHLCQGATEPVNVDSHARQAAQEGLAEAPPTLFLHAQKQIFNLMKFDSYPRFIKSELYKECVVAELSGQPLPFSGGEGLDQGLQLGRSPGSGAVGCHNKLKKSRSDAEDSRRKSLLPWHRKNRSKSKDRGETEYQRLAAQPAQHQEEVSSSRSSLASWDAALRGSDGPALCRVALPDGATTVVQARPNELVRDLVIRLLDKRGLHYSAFEVYIAGESKPVSLDEESVALARQEVKVEPRVVFRLDLPNRKTIGVKARCCKTLGEVLRPILHKYGYRLELVTVCLMSENEVLELPMPVSVADGQRLQVLTRSTEAWKSDAAQKLMCGPTLDEITNRVFEELLQGKVEGARMAASDQGSVKSDDWGSEHSSGIFGRFRRRDSAMHEKTKESRGKNKKASGGPKLPGDEVEARASTGGSKAPLIAKWKVGVKLQGRSESDELYEGLKRAQRSRLEDQRGTEINFELPDFLKDKENAPQAGKKVRKLRLRDDSAPEGEAHVIPSPCTAEEYFASRCPRGVPVDLGGPVSSTDTTLVELDVTLTPGGDGPSRPSDPPPLPPKPRHLPAKTSWTANPTPFKVAADMMRSSSGENRRDPRVCRTRKAVYLDQPSSSFV